MKQIFKANHPVAWIGESAPIPEGWHSDMQTALDEANNLTTQDKEKADGLHEEKTPAPEAVTEPEAPSDDFVVFDTEQHPQEPEPVNHTVKAKRKYTKRN